MTWTSIEDRVPEQYVDVLVYQGGEMHSGHRCAGFWVIGGVFNHDRKGEITHWMPLPDPPEQKEKES